MKMLKLKAFIALLAHFVATPIAVYSQAVVLPPFEPSFVTTSHPTTPLAPGSFTTESPADVANRFPGEKCVDPRLRSGVCVAIAKCPELVAELYAKSNDTEFADYLRASNRNCGGANSAACCLTSGSVVTTVTTPRSTTPLTPGPFTIDSPADATSHLSKIIFSTRPSKPQTSLGLIEIRPARARNSNETPRRPLTFEEGCGFTYRHEFNRVVGGVVSERGAWPWAALLAYPDGYSSSPFKCGGTLVTARHVVTAAHCIRNDLAYVRLGEHDLTTDTETRHEDVNIVRIEAHPQYNSRNGKSDVALLWLERNVQFSDTIAPICLPSTPELRQKSYVRRLPFVVGWGKTMEGGVSANVLQELQIQVFENNICERSYERMKRLFTQDQFDKSILCAGVLFGGKATCQGDSGGPLMMPEKYSRSEYRFYLIGVIAYGVGCARSEVPDVYTSVQHYVDWILQKIADTK